ncbi:MAG: hypothetical protein US95_C0043G0009 [Candidatus Woesebacteria bacterium GW2011_GWB1_38_5]|uniref:Uncharacterized protein n=2 Tax=Candidatus Woeseibacteriota TaxID=1752722 RepID=A0A0G0MJE5_9BACT|nr:MAG: hypothetical protein US75_C0025G0004 [Candidatus Woesebacteria bacterium GW2011_GWC1_38_13]KKQ73854.1 MAG: hypothetical protein US95_C0043G0009 [Candidatus Woesebacteria bacterium GW2011_GWB1_38_5]KKQ76199.1 MAG: hypothetical protein US97_C0017G0006 [Microgenomates group bacterium GW2011_GWF1_38_5]
MTEIKSGLSSSLSEHQSFRNLGGLPDDPSRWFRISMAIFGSKNWESRLSRVVDKFPGSEEFINIGVKDLGMVLTPVQKKELKKRLRTYRAQK